MGKTVHISGMEKYKIAPSLFHNDTLDVMIYWREGLEWKAWCDEQPWYVRLWWRIKRRLSCLHYWIDQSTPHDMVFVNGKYLWKCAKCEKKKYFKHLPLNPII